MKEESMEKIGKALGDTTRLRILSEISKKGSMTCSEAEAVAGLSQPTVSHHINLLIDAGLLNAEKEGRFSRLTVNRKKMEQFASYLKELV